MKRVLPSLAGLAACGFAVPSAGAEPLVLSTPTCETLPAVARAAVCAKPPRFLRQATAGKKTLVLAIHVIDERPTDGPYLETVSAWANWLPADADRDGASVLVSQLLGTLGSVTTLDDAWARIRLQADLQTGTGERIPAIDLPKTETPCPAGIPGWEEGVSLTCGVSADPAVKGAFVAHAWYADDLSCECSVMWSKRVRVAYKLAPDGTLTQTESLAYCRAFPESESASICGQP